VLIAVSDLELAALVAIATTLGAGVGGVIAGLIALRVEQQRRKHDRQREQQVEERDLKEAARLVDEELRDAVGLIGDAIYEGRWRASQRVLSASVYTAYRSVLAISLSDAAWSDVSRAYQEFNRVNWERARAASALPGGGEHVPVWSDAVERADLQEVGLIAIEARVALAPFADPPDSTGLLRDGAEEVAARVFPLPEELDEILRPLLDDHQPSNSGDDEAPAS